MLALLPAAGCRDEYHSVDDSVKKMVTRSGLQTIDLAVRLYHGERGRYPETLDEILRSKNISDRSLIEDAWGREYYYERLDNGYVLFSPGKDGEPFTVDDVYPSAVRPDKDTPPVQA
jgi:hypothetical protein